MSVIAEASLAFDGFQRPKQGVPLSRADLAGLNLAQYPAILIELGNMKNPADVGLITTEEGRQKYADAVVRGIAGFLASQQRAG